jgi:hypothetical protein
MPCVKMFCCCDKNEYMQFQIFFLNISIAQLWMYAFLEILINVYWSQEWQL